MKKWNGEGGRKMPNGVDLGMILAVIIPLFIVTVALRALPFSLLRYLKNSEFMAVLGPHHARGGNDGAGGLHLVRAA
jgi:hypothetical protein